MDFNYPISANPFKLKSTDSSDQDLERRVTTFLSTQHRAALRSLKAEARGGIVTLRGRVSTFYEKQLSAQLAHRVAGVVRLIDEVIVGEIRKDRRQAVVEVVISAGHHRIRRG